MGDSDNPMRPGARENFGFDYEDQMIAYLAVEACNRKDLKDFWIASNIVGLGAWDDVILYTETQHGVKKLQFLQLKHKLNIDIEYKFRDWKGNFEKYTLDYEQISSLMSYGVPNENQYRIKEILNKTGVVLDHCEFILMTNGAFKNHPTLLIKSKNSFIKTNNTGTVYQLSSHMTDVDTHNKFYEQFFIFSEQSGVNDKALLNNIETQLKHFISHTNFKSHKKVAKYLLALVKEWFPSENRTLSFTDVKEKISCGILSTLKHTKPISANGPKLNKKDWDVFQKLIEPYQLVVYSNRDLNLENFFDEQNQHYFIICKKIDIKFIVNCIESAKTIKVIMLVPNEALETVFERVRTLNSLPVDSLALLNDYDIKIQGRETKFKSLLNQFSKIRNIFKVDDIINLLLGKLCIGEDKHFLSYYVPRSIPRIFVERSLIFKLSNSFFIVIVEGNLLESELKIKSAFQSNSFDAEPLKQTRENETIGEWFNFLCVQRDAVRETMSNVEIKFKTVHILKYHENSNDFKLEWVSSTNIKEVKTFIEKEKFDEKVIEDNLEDLSWNNINKVIIVANPGMGKTYLTKNLANNYSVHSWVILVTLYEIDFNHIESFELFLQSYREKLNTNDRKIFELYLRKKSVVVLFDGFDEVAPEYNVEALNLINGVVQEKLKVVVTSREITKEILEVNLGTLAYSLNPFSNDDKIKFLEYFYSQNIKKSDNLDMDVIESRIKRFSSNLLKNCSISNWDEEFTGVPLQCRLLAEEFIQECEHFCETNDLSNIPVNTNLITLYENFIENKFNIYWKEKEQIVAKDMKSFENFTKPHRNEFFSNHMDAAVQIIFPGLSIKISEIFSEEIKTAKEKHGIIIGMDGHNNPMFIHRTFAEYFAAKWLVELKEGTNQFDGSKREEYLRFLLKPEFNVVQDLFDRIICRQCELHNAILSADLSQVRDILEKNGNRDDEKCGRNALHLISARGARHARVDTKLSGNEKYWAIEKTEEEKYLEILDFLMETCHITKEKEDVVLRWTPQRYANDRHAFGVIDRLCGFEGSRLYNLENSFIKKWKKSAILNMCAVYDYSNIGSHFLKLKALKLEEIEELLETCTINDSDRFAEKIIRSKKFNWQHLVSLISKVTYKNKGTLLHVAAENGRANILDVLLKYVDDVNIKNNEGRTPLHVGCEKGHLSVVKALVKNGGNLFIPDKGGDTPMNRAVGAYAPNRELIEYVTSYEVLKIGTLGEDINAALDRNGRRALHYAAILNNMSSLERIIMEGANVNITDKFGYTALHLITNDKYFDTNIARRLIESGLNIDAKTSNKETALQLAVRNWNKRSVELLLQYEASPNIVDKNQRTALHTVVKKWGNEQCVELLLQNGAITNMVDITQQTALHLAAQNWSKECVQLLLQYEANPNIVDFKQQTALSLAREKRRDEIFLLLWDNTEKELRTERDALHKAVLTEGRNVEMRKRTFVGFPEELSRLADTMSRAGFYYYGVKDCVKCFSCECWLEDWNLSDDPWVEHAKNYFGYNCQFLMQEKGKEFIETCRVETGRV